MEEKTELISLCTCTSHDPRITHVLAHTVYVTLKDLEPCFERKAAISNI